MTRPPFAARLLLRCLLPRRLREPIAGDLEEDWYDGRLGRWQFWVLALRSIAAWWAGRLHALAAAARANITPGGGAMTSILQDVHYGARMLRRHPGFTLAAVTTLALGIGANTTIFSLVKAIVLEPLPYHEPSRVAFLLGTDSRSGELRFSMRLGDYVDIARRSRSFSHVAAYGPTGGNLTGGDLPDRVQAYVVTGGTFDLLGVTASLGRTLSPADAQRGQDRVAVLSNGLWRRRFGADADIVGRRIALNGVTHEIVGVMPPTFEFPVFNFKGDIWIPWAFDASAALADRASSGSATVIARLAEGMTLDQAAAEMHTLMQTLAAEHPATNASLGARVVEMGRLDDGQAGPAISIVMGAVLLVLLLACGNVTNLLLARGAARGRELAVRAALGASRRRIARQLLIESAMLALLGAAAGLVLAHVALGAIRAALPELVLATVPNIQAIRIDGVALAFTTAVAVAASLIFGLLPAWRAARPRPQYALKSAETAGGRSTRRLRSALVIAEVALATLLLVGAGLLMRSYGGLRAADPGFSPDKVLTMAMSLPEDRYPTGVDRRRFFEATIERLERLPGVDQAALVNVLPFSTYDRGTRIELEGAPLLTPGQERSTALRVISPGYFGTMSIPVGRGRAFTAADREGSMPVAVVNRAFVQRYLDDDGIGRRIRLGDAASGNPWMTIVGVVGDVHHSRITQAPGPELYLPLAQGAPPMMMLALRAVGDPRDLVLPVRRLILEVDPQQPVFHVKLMEQLVADAMLAHTASAASMSVFSTLALVLAIIGVYSVVSYGVSQQMREFGVRLAVGATPAGLVRLVIRRSTWLVGTGVMVGSIAAMAVTGALASVLYGVQPLDPLTYALAGGFMVSLGVLASLVPAWRASTAEPLSALRAD